MSALRLSNKPGRTVKEHRNIVQEEHKKIAKRAQNYPRGRERSIKDCNKSSLEKHREYKKIVNGA